MSCMNNLLTRSNMKKILFLCTHNSARSQMAEGLLRELGKDKYQVFSAGTEAAIVRPQAIAVMKELGIDISHQRSKTFHRFFHENFDEVITVCDQANESCPVFPNAQKRTHWSYPDPSKAEGTDEEIMSVYRKVRDSIKQKIKSELLTKKLVESKTL